jgi:hypothetical protein
MFNCLSLETYKNHTALNKITKKYCPLPKNMVNKCKSLYQHVQLNQVVITLVWIKTTVLPKNYNLHNNLIICSNNIE